MWAMITLSMFDATSRYSSEEPSALSLTCADPWAWVPRIGISAPPDNEVEAFLKELAASAEPARTTVATSASVAGSVLGREWSIGFLLMHVRGTDSGRELSRTPMWNTRAVSSA